MTAFRTVITAMSLALLLPQAARAQSVTRSFDDLPATLKLGQKVVVTHVDGSTFEGSLRAITASEIRIEMLGTLETVTRRNVQSVAVVGHRPPILGPVVGGAIGLVAGSYLLELTRDCAGCKSNGDGSFRALTTTIGALAGFAIEGVQRVEHVRYWAPAKTVSIAPVFSPSRKSLTVVFRF